MTPGERLTLLAHELRSPVAALEAIAQTLRTAADALEPAERARLLRLAVDACRDVERLLDDPDVVSLASGPVDVATLVDGLRAERVAADSAPGLVVEGDAVRLRQALRNLVGNGLRHGHHVVVTARAQGDRVLVDVSDDGPGVDPELDLFRRGVSGAGSTGLGLYLAREIAHAHGGTLELVPVPGAGATFRLSLPCASGANG